MSHITLPLSYERKVWSLAPSALVCGVDEAGRGPLAGPVVAAACVLLPPHLWAAAGFKGATDTPPVAGVNDSKEQREGIFAELLSCPAMAFGVSVVDAAVIDRINILQAAMLAMERAVANAREEVLRRVSLRKESPSSSPADEIGYSAAGASRPRVFSTGARDLHASGALHTVFVDGPRCPSRVAAVAGAERYEGVAPLSAAKKPTLPLSGRKRGESALDPAEVVSAASAAAAALAADAGLVVSDADSLLCERIGPIHTAQPVIGGDAKVYSIAAGLFTSPRPALGVAR
jgi:Ribonuclease HII